jgi:hypothetical protein
MDGRLQVVESDTRRLDECYSELEKRVRTIEKDTGGIPRIEKMLDNVLLQLKNLSDSKIAQDAADKKMISWWDSPIGKIIWQLLYTGVISIIVLFFSISQHLTVGK